MASQFPLPSMLSWQFKRRRGAQPLRRARDRQPPPVGPLARAGLSRGLPGAPGPQASQRACRRLPPPCGARHMRFCFAGLLHVFGRVPSVCLARSGPQGIQAGAPVHPATFPIPFLTLGATFSISVFPCRWSLSMQTGGPWGTASRRRGRLARQTRSACSGSYVTGWHTATAAAWCTGRCRWTRSC